MTDPSSSPGSRQDYTFGQVAIRENLCTFEQVKECLDIQTKLRGLGIEPKKLGEILIEKGYLTPEQAVQVGRLQTQSAQAQPKVAIPGYEIMAKIGQGAMGAVYKGRQVSMDRMVAIKILSAKYAKDRLFVDRFVREARAVAKLNHENIISGIDVGEANGLHYFVMEFVDGQPVSADLKRAGRIEEKRCLQIAMQIAKALVHAHRHGIVHRDVKPENIMITTSAVAKLCDLGLAKQTKGDADVTMDGTSVGTPNYISPEQARGEDKIDIRTDIYSLGASLYHMAVGSPPFSGANPMVVMTKHVTEYPDPPRKRNPALSEPFSNFVMKMMQKRREDRPQDPEQLIVEIEALLRGEEPAAARAQTQTGRAAAPAERKHPSTVRAVFRGSSSSSKTPLFIGIGVAAVALIGFLAFGGGGSSKITPPPPPPVVGPGPVKDPLPADPPTDRVQKDLQDFRALVDSQLQSSAQDRFTSLHAQLVRKIKAAKDLADFAGQRAWTEELAAYVQRVNKLVTTNVWEPVKRRVDAEIAAGRPAKALEELGQFEEVYKWLRNDEVREKTDAGKEHEGYVARLKEQIEGRYLTDIAAVERAFAGPKKDDAYAQLDVLAATSSPEFRAKAEEKRREYLQKEVDSILGGETSPEKARKALERVEQLRRLHAGNPAALTVIENQAQGLRSLVAAATKDAATGAVAAFADAHPRIEEALRQRDLVAARGHLFRLLYSKETAAFQSHLLPAPADPALKPFLDPLRAVPGEARKVAAMAEAGLKFCQQPGTLPAAKDLYLDLLRVALVDDLLEMALEGARVQARDPAKFRQGYSPALRDAVSADPLPRKAGEAPALSVQAGPAKSVVFVAPATARPVLTEEDVVALAKRAPAGANDPQFAQKAFTLCIFGGKLAHAKDWYDRLSPEARIGTERWVDALKGAVSVREEQEAERLYQEAGVLWRKKDEKGASAKFRECVEKYGNTEYMKRPIKLSSGETKTRTQIVDEQFPSSSKPKGAVSPGKAGLPAAFATPDVKELGRGRYEVTYAFKDDRELSLFSVVEGSVTPGRSPTGGVQLSGLGYWYWNVPLRGAVTMEVNFRMDTPGPLLLVVCGDGSKSGYAAILDLPLGGPAPLDGIFRMPLGEGPAIFNSVLTQGGPQIAIQPRMPQTAVLSREGSKVRIKLGAGSLECDHPAFNAGRTAIGVVGANVLVEKLRITGEPDPAWLDAELKRVEGR